MILDNGTAFAIIVALGGSLFTMLMFWKQNVELIKENYRLRNELRKSKLL